MEQFSKEKIKEIEDATDIVALVSEYVKLEKAGKNYRGLCPFHDEKTPSFFVNEEIKTAHCFSCGGGGRPINFLMQIKNISFREAVIELAKRNNIELDIKEDINKGPDLSKYYEINKKTLDFYRYFLDHSKEGLLAKDYLHKRGFSDEIIDMFQIGFAPNKRDSLYNVLSDQKVLPLDMIDLGLIGTRDDKYYDMFRNRIIFPIIDEKKQVIAFSARTTEKGVQPKYINSPETKVFKKGLSLYNLNNALSDIRKKHRVILHEGFADVIASTRSGLGESICSMGTSLTSNQAQKIASLAKEVVICYDGDKAGIAASQKAIKILEHAGLKVSLVMLPDSLDPDDYVKKYSENEYAEYFLKNTVFPLDYLYNAAFIGKDLKNYQVCEDIKQNIFNLLASEHSQIVVEKFIERLSNDLGVSKVSLVADYSDFSKRQQMPFEQSHPFDSSPRDNLDFGGVRSNIDFSILSGYEQAQIRLIKYASHSATLLSRLEAQDVLSFLDEVHKQIFLAISSTYEIVGEFNESFLLNLLLSDFGQAVCDIYINDNRKIREYVLSDPFDECNMIDCIYKIKKSYYEKNIKDLELKIAYSKTDDEKQEFLCQKLAWVQKNNGLKKG